jgi:hypothetical protein
MKEQKYEEKCVLETWLRSMKWAMKEVALMLNVVYTSFAGEWNWLRIVANDGAGLCYQRNG